MFFFAARSEGSEWKAFADRSPSLHDPLSFVVDPSM
jgi:hypothetical protein